MNVAGDAERTADLVVLEHHHPRLPAFDRESGKDLGLTTFTVRRQVVEPREPCFLQERVQRPGLDHRLDLVIPRITGAEVQQVLEPRTTPWVRTELSEQGFPVLIADSDLPPELPVLPRFFSEVGIRLHTQHVPTHLFEAEGVA